MTEIDRIGPRPDDLISERDVMQRWGHLFGKRELSQARKDGLIRAWKMRRSFFYTEETIAKYIASKETEPCPSPQDEEPENDSPSTNTGSTGSKKTETGTGTGMSPELEKSAADLLAQRIMKPPSANSRRTSSAQHQTNQKTRRT